LVGDVTMIDVEPFGTSAGIGRAADGTLAFLCREHLGVSAARYTEAPHEFAICCPIGMSVMVFPCFLSVVVGMFLVPCEGGRRRTNGTIFLSAIARRPAAVKLIERLCDAALRASLLGWWYVGRRFGVFGSPDPMPVGQRTGFAVCGEAVSVTRVLVKLRDRLILSAKSAALSVHCRPHNCAATA